MKNWNSVVFSACAVALLSTHAHADIPATDASRLEKMQKQIDTLQDSLDGLRLEGEKEEPIRSFSAKNFHLGGWINESLESIQASGSDRYGVNESEVSLLASVDVDAHTRVFLDLQFDRALELENSNTAERRYGAYEDSVAIEIAQISHDFSDRFGIRAGQLIAPFGIINVEHFDPVLLQHQLPQFLRDQPDEPFGMFDDIVQGIDTYGNFNIPGGHRFNWEAYAASLQSDTNKLGGGGRQAWTFPGHVTIGSSQQAGNREGHPFLTLGQDVKIGDKKFVLKAESAQTLITGSNLYTWYVQPAYSLTDKWIVFYQADYFSNALNRTEGVLDPIKQYEHTLGVNFLPIKNIRMRAEVADHHYVGDTRRYLEKSRDFISLQTSITVSF